jgi:hypothetical protein
MPAKGENTTKNESNAKQQHGCEVCGNTMKNEDHGAHLIQNGNSALQQHTYQLPLAIYV